MYVLYLHCNFTTTNYINKIMHIRNRWKRNYHMSTSVPWSTLKRLTKAGQYKHRIHRNIHAKNLNISSLPNLDA